VLTVLLVQPVPQLEAIRAWAEDLKIWYKFENLPPADELHFVQLLPGELREKNMLGTKLFLGQNDYHKTWAFIKIFSESKQRSAEVVFKNVTPDNTVTTVREFPDLALMYPFHVFKRKGKKENMRI
jgi:hypothetical protein